MKGGIDRLKPEYLRSWSKPLQVLSDLPVSRNWYKTVSNLYKNQANTKFCAKIVGLNRSYSAITQQSERADNSEEPNYYY